MATKFMAFEAFYRDNPPRVFVYYVFFPILFPYWLVVKRARREFLLFRGLSIVALVILIGLALLQYFTKWAPDIGFGAFAAIFGIIFLVQGFVVLTFLMPLATTVIGYQTTRKYKRLVVLFAAMAFSTTAAIIVHAKKRHDIVPAMTVARIGLRTAAAQEKAAAALQEGMIRAINEADAHPEAAGLEKDVEGGVELTGATVEAAREGLATYYKDDETHGFILAVVRDPRFGGTLVLYAVDSAGKPLIWLASVKVKGQWRVLKGDALAPESVAIMTKIAKK